MFLVRLLGNGEWLADYGEMRRWMSIGKAGFGEM